MSGEEIQNTWLVTWDQEAMEPVPLVDLSTLPGWDSLVRYVIDILLAEKVARMIARDRKSTVARFTGMVGQYQIERDQAVTTIEAMLDESARWAGTEMGRTLAERLRHVVEQQAR